MIELLAKLLIAHAVCDYPLQGDFLSKAKNPSAPISGVPWQWAMASHAAIHAGAVWALTGSAWLALFEFVAHASIDYLKCVGVLTFSQDQWLHVICKVVWAVGGES